MEGSIVVPTYNKALYLELTLESLYHQNYEKSEYEVIVVDDGSTDGVRIVAEHYARRNWNFHFVVQQLNAGRNIARNKGLANARGRVIIFIDDDCICSRNFIVEHMARHDGTRNKVVLGVRREVFTRIPMGEEAFINTFAKSLYEMDSVVAKETLEQKRASLPMTCDLVSTQDIIHNMHKIDLLSMQKEQLDDLVIIAQSLHACPWYFFKTANASVDRVALIHVGQFDENFVGWGEEDTELGYRFFRAGVEFDATLDAIVYHQVHPRNRQIQVKEWLHNYRIFAEKHKTLEIYLKWQVNFRLISMKQYEAIIGRLKTGFLNDTEKNFIKQSYDQFVANGMKGDISWPPKKAQFASLSAASLSKEDSPPFAGQ